MAHFADAPRTGVIPLATQAPAADALRKLDRLIWGLIALTAAIVAFAPLAGFTILWGTYAAPVGAAAVLLAIGAFYRHRRGEERIASAVEGTAQLALFAAVGAPLSYLAARLALPLWDHVFDTADKMLGLDWIGLLAWMNAHRSVHAVL